MLILTVLKERHDDCRIERRFWDEDGVFVFDSKPSLPEQNDLVRFAEIDIR